MNTKKIQITFSGSHLESLEEYAVKHKLFRGGEPNISEAIRRSSAEGLGKPELAEGVLMGNPEKRAKS